MKYTISSRQPPKFLKSADEITLRYNDYNYLYTLLEKYPEKPISMERWNVDSPFSYSSIPPLPNVLLGTISIPELISLKKKGYKAYYLLPATTLQEVKYFQSLEVDALRVEGPLFHSLPTLPKNLPPLRQIANSSYSLLYPYQIHSWIRPEDVSLYEPYIDTLSFSYETLQEERALYKIYAIDKTFQGPLNLLIKDLNYSIPNSSLPQDFGARRLNCRQPLKCTYCFRTLELNEKLKEIKNESKRNSN